MNATSVFIDSKYSGEMKREDISKLVKEKKYNVVCTKDNGYSRCWNEIEKYDENKNYGRNIYLTSKQELGFVSGSSEVSFS